MNTLDAIEKRAGCRKYLDKDVEKELIGIILNAGRLAPSAGNLQDRCFIVVKDKQKKSDIAKASGNQSWMQTAPVMIVVVSEGKKNVQFFGERGDKIYTVQDTAFSVENMLIAATDLGLGSSLVVGFNEDKLKEVLEIPDPAKPFAIITVGHAVEPPKSSSKYPVDRFVYFEKYGAKVENTALEFGELGTLREQLAAKTIVTTKKAGKGVFDKIISLFKKKEEPAFDYFMEEKPKLREIKDEGKEEIPRQLPRKF